MNSNEFVLWLSGYLEATENAKFEYIVDVTDPIKNKLKEVVPVEENKTIEYVPTPTVPGVVPPITYPPLWTRTTEIK